MGTGVWKLLSDVGQMQSTRASGMPARGYHKAMRLPRVPGGIFGTVLWMVIGAAVALVLQPYFPPEMVEWLEKG